MLICANVALEGVCSNNRLTAVASSCAWIHTSRYNAIYYIVLKLDNNDQTYISVIRNNRTYCMHTGCKKIDTWNWEQARQNRWVGKSLGLFPAWYFFFIFFHQPQAWKHTITWRLLSVCIGLYALLNLYKTF